MTSHNVCVCSLRVLPWPSSGFGIPKIQFLQHVHNDLGNNEPGVFLIIGRHDIPWSGRCAGSTKTLLIGLHILRPELSFPDIGGAEFPVLVGFVDTREKALSLLLL